MPTAAAAPRVKRAYRNNISSIAEQPGPAVQYVDYEPRGACRDIFLDRSPELIIDGPAGTGKSRACLEKCHWLLEKYPRIRGLMIRKTRKSMTQSCIVTFEQEVLPSPKYVPFHGTDNQYNYPNGSIFAVSGLDDPTKIYSSFWDFAYVNQAEELTEDEWTQIGSRLRNFKMSYKGTPWTQLLGDDNPVHPQHWIPARAAILDDDGKHVLTKLASRHEDNPVYWDAEKSEWTVKGKIYIATLDRLFGVLKKRLRYGIWAAAEGAVYEESWDRARHIIPRFFAETDLRHDQVPKEWPRYWTVDFGYKNPFYWAAFAKDPDGRLILYKQMYMTGRLVEDHARRILEYTADDPAPKAIICDHDAEDRATLWKHISSPIPAALMPKSHPFLERLKTHCVQVQTKGAYKAVSQGIQAVEARLRVQEDGKPRLMYLADSLVEADPTLRAAKLPICTEDEYEVYCLTAETQISTERGLRPLADVKVGDKVWTRSGLRSVINSGLTQTSARVFRVNLSNGSSITGTGNHPVFVKGKGFVPISRLLPLDIMESCESHVNRKSSCSMAFATGAIRSLSTGLLGSITGRICRTSNNGRLSQRLNAFAHSAKNLFLAVLPKRASYAHLVVTSIQELPLRQPVYNLTVDDCPEYFANGVLVHNCWDKTNNKKKGEEPHKDYDHGKDGDRYLVAYVDEVGKNTPKMFGIIGVTKSGGGSGGDGGLTQRSGFRMDGASGLSGGRWSNT